MLTSPVKVVSGAISFESLSAAFLPVTSPNAFFERKAFRSGAFFASKFLSNVITN